MSSLQTLSSSSDPSALPDVLRPFGDVPCRIEIILGAGAMTLRTCLGLQKGSVIKLSRSAGQDLDLIINGVTLARGEVVIIDDSVSLRLTDLPRAAGEGR